MVPLAVTRFEIDLAYSFTQAQAPHCRFAHLQTSDSLAHRLLAFHYHSSPLPIFLKSAGGSLLELANLMQGNT
jgi:hypothetical protein